MPDIPSGLSATTIQVHRAWVVSLPFGAEGPVAAPIEVRIGEALWLEWGSRLQSFAADVAWQAAFLFAGPVKEDNASFYVRGHRVLAELDFERRVVTIFEVIAPPPPPPPRDPAESSPTRNRRAWGLGLAVLAGVLVYLVAALRKGRHDDEVWPREGDDSGPLHPESTRRVTFTICTLDRGARVQDALALPNAGARDHLCLGIDALYFVRTRAWLRGRGAQINHAATSVPSAHGDPLDARLPGAALAASARALDGIGMTDGTCAGPDSRGGAPTIPADTSAPDTRNDTLGARPLGTMLAARLLALDSFAVAGRSSAAPTTLARAQTNRAAAVTPDACGDVPDACSVGTTLGTGAGALDGVAVAGGINAGLGTRASAVASHADATALYTRGEVPDAWPVGAAPHIGARALDVIAMAAAASIYVDRGARGDTQANQTFQWTPTARCDMLGAWSPGATLAADALALDGFALTAGVCIGLGTHASGRASHVHAWSPSSNADMSHASSPGKTVAVCTWTFDGFAVGDDTYLDLRARAAELTGDHAVSQASEAHGHMHGSWLTITTFAAGARAFDIFTVTGGGCSGLGEHVCLLGRGAQTDRASTQTSAARDCLPGGWLTAPAPATIVRAPDGVALADGARFSTSACAYAPADRTIMPAFDAGTVLDASQSGFAEVVDARYLGSDTTADNNSSEFERPCMRQPLVHFSSSLVGMNRLAAAVKTANRLVRSTVLSRVEPLDRRSEIEVQPSVEHQHRSLVASLRMTPVLPQLIATRDLNATSRQLRGAALSQSLSWSGARYRGFRVRFGLFAKLRLYLSLGLWHSARFLAQLLAALGRAFRLPVRES